MSLHKAIPVSIVVSIPARHAGDRDSIPRRGPNYFGVNTYVLSRICFHLFHQSLQIFINIILYS